MACNSETNGMAMMELVLYAQEGLVVGDVVNSAIQTFEEDLLMDTRTLVMLLLVFAQYVLEYST